MSAQHRQSTIYVYGLADSAGRIRYVGKSTNPAARLHGHLSGRAASAVRAWAASLPVRPEIRILRECLDQTEAAIAEQEEIASRGSELLNTSFRVDTREPTRRSRFNGFGERCLARRRDLHLAQVDVERLSGLSSGMLSRIEHGVALHVTAETAVGLARTLQATVEWLVTGETALVERVA